MDKHLVSSGLLADVPGIVAAFTTRHAPVGIAHGDLGYDLGTNTETAAEARRAHQAALLRALDFHAEADPSDVLVLAGQVHGAEVETVAAAGIYRERDALVTDQPGLLLAIQVADCAPVLLADPEARVVGAAHSGWRGTVANIAARTVAAMQALGAEPSRMRAYVGPCISQAHFEVGPEVAAQFEERFVVIPSPGAKPHVDLKGVLRAQLLGAGLAEAHLDIDPGCTVADNDRFFSYRAEKGQTGRMLGVVGLREG
ncbi:MAG: peptidoglycan editing factor PgeF [Bacteroidota bacterium]